MPSPPSQIGQKLANPSAQNSISSPGFFHLPYPHVCHLMSYKAGECCFGWSNLGQEEETGDEKVYLLMEMCIRYEGL